MKKFIGPLKLRNIWDALIVISFISLAITLSAKLNSISKSIETSNVAELRVTDYEQLEAIIENIAVDQWKCRGYALYIMQPKNYKKTYKELQITSETHVLPYKVDLSNEVEFELNLYKKKWVQLNHNETNFHVKSDETLVVVPIYHHRVIVAELYVIFDNFTGELFVDDIHNRMVEAQVIGKLIE